MINDPSSLLHTENGSKPVFQAATLAVQIARENVHVCVHYTDGRGLIPFNRLISLA